MGDASTAPTAPLDRGRPIERQNSLERARALVYRPPKSTNAVVPASSSSPAKIDPSFYTHMATYQPTEMGSVRESSNRAGGRRFPAAEAEAAEEAEEAGASVGVSKMTVALLRNEHAEAREELRLAEERKALLSGEEREHSEAREQLRRLGERKAHPTLGSPSIPSSPSSPLRPPSIPSSPLRPPPLRVPEESERSSGAPAAAARPEAVEVVGAAEATAAAEAVQRRLEEMAAEQRGLREQQSRLEGEVAALRAQREADHAQREAERARAEEVQATTQAVVAQLQAAVRQLQAELQRTRRRLAAPTSPLATAPQRLPSPQAEIAAPLPPRQPHQPLPSDGIRCLPSPSCASAPGSFSGASADADATRRAPVTAGLRQAAAEARAPKPAAAPSRRAAFLRGRRPRFATRSQGLLGGQATGVQAAGTPGARPAVVTV